MSRHKLCYEKKTKNQELRLSNLQMGKDFKDVGAVYMEDNLWKNGSTIKIQFLNDNSSGLFSPWAPASWTPMHVLENQQDVDGNIMRMDPIENDIRILTPIEAVKKVVLDRIQPYVNLNFVFLDGVISDRVEGDIRIYFNDLDGAWSVVGKDVGNYGISDPNVITMNLGWLDTGTILHEFCHALGMIHEHQNPFENKIKWDREKVYEYFMGPPNNWDKDTIDANILDPPVGNLNGSNYDKDSIMLYYYPGSLTTDGKGTNQNLTLSSTDALWLYKKYPKENLSSQEIKSRTETIYKNMYPDSRFVPLESDNKNFKDIIDMLSANTNVLIGLGVILLIVILYYLFKKD